ncbi:cupin domain-containing protein [Lachnospiraceae bacterium OttesenSCG-928-D06]|nr:cupin domain-containing protein [Lachnospiraceae bacterium OttesenSCG-928-D06]
MEKVYSFKQSAEKLIEKILDDDVAMINHMILNQGEALPRHDSNSNVYMIIVRGALTIQLANEPEKRYENGTILNIPGGITMNIHNNDLEQVEFFVIKAPSPRLYK